MRVFVFGDCHIGRYNLQQVTEESFVVWDWVEKHIAQVDIVIFLGDRFRSRDPEGSIRDIGDVGLWRIAKKKPVIAICGNHDFYYKHGSIENNYGVMKQIDNVTVVVDRAKVQLDGVNLEFLAFNQIPSGQGDYLFMHDEIIGVCSWARTGIQEGSLRGYKKVYSGHIHQRMKKDNITYIGVPFQQDFKDGEVTGGLIVDLATGMETWIDGYGIKFVTGLRDSLVDCVVRVETEEQKEEALKRGALFVEVIESQEATVVEATESAVNMEGWESWIDEYVDRYADGSQVHKNIGRMLIDTAVE